jgi:outer membrane biogenesis lipoprotein LolB
MYSGIDIPVNSHELWLDGNSYTNSYCQLLNI